MTFVSTYEEPTREFLHSCIFSVILILKEQLLAFKICMPKDLDDYH